jgi:hypothetical protein
MVKKFLGLGFSLLTLVGCIAPVDAQVQVSPLIVSTETKQGKAQGVITLSNLGDTATRVRLSSAPFTYARDGFEVLGSSEDDLSPYLIFSPAELSLEPGQTRRVRLTSLLLPSLEGREFKSVIFVEPLRETGEGLNVLNRVGVTVYVRHGEVNHRLTVLDADYDVADRRVEVLVNNGGNGTIRPGVRWQMFQGTTPVAEDTISGITVVAGGDRLIPIQTQGEGLKSGDYRLVGELFWGNAFAPQKLPFEFDVMVP